MADGLELLELVDSGEGRFDAPMPEGSPEGRDVIFGGQILAQSIMAACANPADPKIVKSIHTIFARAGTYAQPLHYQVTQVHDGRTFGSKTISAWQGERMLASSIVLMTAGEDDLIAHHLAAPDGLPTPEQSGPPQEGSSFPGSIVRMAGPDDQVANGVPVSTFWTRMLEPVPSVAASQAVLSWSTNGWLIGLAMEAHRDAVSLEQAHNTISTGVIAHTIHFHREFDAASWMGVAQEATFAGRGRVHGRGTVFDESGVLLATFAQDSMVKAVDSTATSLGTRSRM